MKISLAQYTSVELNKQVMFITSFSDELKNYFTDKSYGNDLKEIAIGVICVSIGFENFFKPRKPKYTKDVKKVESEGFSYEIEKCLEYDLKLDFGTFKKGTEEENKKLLAREILASLSVLDTMKSKIKDFDAEKFKADLEGYFKEKGLV